MIHGYSDPMEEDPYAFSQPEQTQQATQSQEEEQQEPWNDHLWGFLRPTRPGLKRIDLWRVQATYTIGRSSDNLIIFPNLKVSNKHCQISWDGNMSKDATVTVQDLSSNGTFINGRKIGRNKSAILRDGNEIAFGQWVTTHSGPDDFRFIFRLAAGGMPTQGLHAHYDIGNELGRGSFATVMRAVNRTTGRTYAIKMIHRNKFRSASEGSVKLFLREVAILEQLEHPNICYLKETFQDESSINLVLEYVEGGDMLDYIISRDGISEDESRSFTYQLCDALKYIHAKGIAHRDLKPENILLTKDTPPILKVADFGLAKAVDSMTQFKTTCGTPIYLAPEVILRNAEESYSHVVDSWSVGVIVFSMIANSNPFVEDAQTTMEIRFRSRYIDWSALFNKGITTVCKNFLDRLLKEDPKVRMTCGEALEHPWLAVLAPQSESLPALASTPGIAAGAESFSSTHASVGSESVTGSSFVSVTTPLAQQAGMSSRFEHIRMEDGEGAAPVSKGRRLERHPMEVADLEAAGNILSFEQITAGPSEPRDGRGNEDGADSRKRKERSESLMAHDFDHDGRETAEDGTSGASDSSLTPVSEDEDGGAAPGRNLRSANAHRKAPLTNKQPQDNDPQRRGARGKAPAKRTRGAVRQAGDDVDM
ncbi:hypothetical protein M0805_007701 [Coniferiporia weirii]|nr:hypothetical protein M0805_007701 [Coniferiporia weirii]